MCAFRAHLYRRRRVWQSLPANWLSYCGRLSRIAWLRTLWHSNISVATYDYRVNYSFIFQYCNRNRWDSPRSKFLTQFRTLHIAVSLSKWLITIARGLLLLCYYFNLYWINYRKMNIENLLLIKHECHIIKIKIIVVEKLL